MPDTNPSTTCQQTPMRASIARAKLSGDVCCDAACGSERVGGERIVFLIRRRQEKELNLSLLPDEKASRASASLRVAPVFCVAPADTSARMDRLTE